MKPVEKMTYQELLETQQRQKKTLSNKTLLQRLPDKGKKLLETQAKVEERLQKLQKESEELSDMFAGMNLSSCSRVDVNQMEWTGKISAGDSSICNPSSQQGNEEDERDIVNILLSANLNSKIVIDERNTTNPSPTATKPAASQESFYQHLAEKVEHIKPVDHKFKPFKTLKHEKDSSSKHFHKWDENTAATPPIFKYNDGAKSIHIEESLELQIKIDEKLKLLETKRSSVKFIPDTVMKPEEQDEVYDEDPEGGGLAICIPTEPEVDAE